MYFSVHLLCSFTARFSKYSNHLKKMSQEGEISTESCLKEKSVRLSPYSRPRQVMQYQSMGSFMATCKKEMLEAYKEQREGDNIALQAEALLPQNVAETIRRGPESAPSPALMSMLESLMETSYRRRDSAGTTKKKKDDSATQKKKNFILQFKLAYACSTTSKIIRQGYTPPLQVLVSAYMYSRGHLGATKGTLNTLAVTVSPQFIR
jgi:hypothetical protein